MTELAAGLASNPSGATTCRFSFRVASSIGCRQVQVWAEDSWAPPRTDTRGTCDCPMSVGSPVGLRQRYRHRFCGPPRVFISILGVVERMKSRLSRVWSRAKHAAIFAAVGAGIGGLFGRGAASSGAALGAAVGATIGEKRASIGPLSERVPDEVSGVISSDE